MNIDDIWVIEYLFYFDAFSVRRLSESMERSQRHFHKKTISPDSVIFAGSEAECRNQAAILQADRNDNPLSIADRLKEFQKAVDGLNRQIQKGDQ